MVDSCFCPSVDPIDSSLFFFLQHIRAKKIFNIQAGSNYFFQPKAASDYFLKKSSSSPQIMKWSLPKY